MARRTSLPVLTFKASAMRVRVPASAANLGPAFDAAGLALDWYDDMVAQVSDDPGIGDLGEITVGRRVVGKLNLAAVLQRF